MANPVRNVRQLMSTKQQYKNPFVITTENTGHPMVYQTQPITEHTPTIVDLAVERLH